MEEQDPSYELNKNSLDKPKSLLDLIKETEEQTRLYGITYAKSYEEQRKENLRRWREEVIVPKEEMKKTAKSSAQEERSVKDQAKRKHAEGMEETGEPTSRKLHKHIELKMGRENSHYGYKEQRYPNSQRSNNFDAGGYSSGHDQRGGYRGGSKNYGGRDSGPVYLSHFDRANRGYYDRGDHRSAGCSGRLDHDYRGGYSTGKRGEYRGGDRNYGGGDGYPGDAYLSDSNRGYHDRGDHLSAGGRGGLDHDHRGGYPSGQRGEYWGGDRNYGGGDRYTERGHLSHFDRGYIDRGDHLSAGVGGGSDHDYRGGYPSSQRGEYRGGDRNYWGGDRDPGHGDLSHFGDRGDHRSAGGGGDSDPAYAGVSSGGRRNYVGGNTKYCGGDRSSGQGGGGH